MKLTERHQRAAELMVQGWGQTRTADLLGVSPVTVRKWTRDKTFQALINEIRERVREATEGAMIQGRLAALASLTEMATDPSLSPEDRHRAAETLLDRTGDNPNNGDGRDAVMAQLLAKLMSPSS